jgi:threonine/homoserine/homoserine lactone efflux protein
MLSVIGQVLPEAAVIAFSPFPIVGMIMLLFTKEARTNSLMFVLGWLLGLVAVAVVVLGLVSAGMIATGQDTVDSGVRWVSVLFGAALVVLAYRYWQKRPQAGEPVATPKWMESLDSISARGALGLGVLLSAVNPKSLLLAIAAVLTVASTDLAPATIIIATIVFILLASITVIGLFIYVRIAGASAENTLNQAKAWLIQYNATIMAVILLALGAKLIWQGIKVA